MALGILALLGVLEVQRLPLSLSYREGRASLGLLCLLLLLEHQVSLLGLEVPPANQFLPFLLVDQESHHILDLLSYPLVQGFLGILEGLEGLLFLEIQGSLSFLLTPCHHQDPAFLDGRDFQDVQGSRQVQQAPNIQVAQVALFLLSFPRHLAILVLPWVLVVLALCLLNNLALPYLLGNHEYLGSLFFQGDLGVPKFLSLLWTLAPPCSPCFLALHGGPVLQDSHCFQDLLWGLMVLVVQVAL